MQIALEASELRIEMNRNPRCVVIEYDEDGNQLETYTVDRNFMANVKSRALVMPWPIDEVGKLDDEFARKLGGTSLLLLAAHQPELKRLISVTQATGTPAAD
jgi:hypothetical protein